VGRYGLLEPVESAPIVEIDSIGLVLVPCVAVDPMGGRLGRGAGWYDRALRDAGSRKTHVIASVHSFQIVGLVPTCPGDRSVDAIVSESGLIEAGR
jgi:5-formyltetrahydrofolate cyclo-ligase